MNHTSIRKLHAQGFTLIELLIVVIIIAILAAIAIPQFSNTTADAQESTLDANLNNLRSAIEMYRVQHNNVFPAAAASSGGSNCPAGGTAGNAAVNTADAFRDQLLGYSDAAGHTCSVSGPGFIYGPYLRDQLPSEPISNPPSNAIVVDNVSTSPAAATGGWHYNYTSGRIEMNSNASDRHSQPYYKH
jgi:general secretion pathway protein G